MGVYGSLEGAIKKAQITQDDLLREWHYGANNYKLDRINIFIYYKMKEYLNERTKKTTYKIYQRLY